MLFVAYRFVVCWVLIQNKSVWNLSSSSQVFKLRLLIFHSVWEGFPSTPAGNVFGSNDAVTGEEGRAFLPRSPPCGNPCSGDPPRPSRVQGSESREGGSLCPQAPNWYIFFLKDWHYRWQPSPTFQGIDVLETMFGEKGNMKPNSLLLFNEERLYLCCFFSVSVFSEPNIKGIWLDKGQWVGKINGPEYCNIYMHNFVILTYKKIF